MEEVPVVEQQQVEGRIPEQRLYFKIGEVARIVGVKPYVLRYWESEFRMLRPGKTRSRHRIYRRKDVELLLRIKTLLHDQRFTIEGARKQLKAEAEEAGAGWSSDAQIRELERIRDELQALRESLR